MKKKISIVAAVIISSHLVAQDTTAKAMDEVVITANKVAQKESATGKVVTVITREQIQQSGGKDVSQILNEQAGIILNGATSNQGKDKSLFLLGATSSYTLILLDGVPVNDPSSVGGTFDLRLFSLENIERIEILKGSQSTLYGSNAVAGVINIISRKPISTKPVISGLASYGSLSTFKGSANVSQQTKWLEYDVNYTYNRTDGISEARDTTGTANFDKDGFVQHAVQALIGINLTDHLKISPYYRFTQFKGGYDDDAFIDGNDHFTSSLVNTGLTGHYQYGSGTLHFNYGYDFTKRDYLSGFGDYFTKGKFNQGEAYVDQRLSDMLQLVAGIDFQSYHLNDVDSTNKIISPYANLLVKTSSGFNLELGGRYNHHNIYGSNFTYSLNPSYLINGNLKLFANITSGFRPPSVSELYGYGGNPNLKPEQSTTQELGLQASALNHKLDVTLMGFNRQINDVIIYGSNGYENHDKQHDYGVELSADYRIANKVSLRLSYDYVNGKVTKSLTGKDTSYFNLIRRPKNNVHFFINYNISTKFLVSASLQVTGKRTDTYTDPNTFIPSQVDLKGYTLLNLYAQYKIYENQLILFVDAKNVTNKTDYYEVYGYGVPGIGITGGIRFQF